MTRTPSLALRSLRARPSRTLLTTSGIVLGVAVILAISVTNRSTLDSLKSVFSGASGRAHLVVISSTEDGEGFAEDVLRRTVNVPGVQAAIPSLQAQVLLADEALPSQMDVNFLGTVAGGLTLYGVDPSLDSQVREYKIVAGQFLSPDQDAYEVVLGKDYADDKGIQVGRDLRIITLEGVERLRVVGLMSKEGAGQLNNGAFGIVPLRAAQEIFGRVGDLDQIDIMATPQAASGAELDNLKAALQERLGDEYTVTYPAMQGKRVIQMLDVYQMGLNFFSVIALFVGAFLIYNAFSMTVVERTREIGMLRAVGMTQRQVMGQILTEAVILGIVGSALGVGAGILLSRSLIRTMEFLLTQDVKEIHVPLNGLVTSVLVGVCVTMVAAVIPARQAGRISPVEAMRIRGSSRESWIIRRGWILGIGLVCVSALIFSYNFASLDIQILLSSPAVFGLFIGATLLIPVTVGAWERAARPAVRRIYGGEGRLGSSNIQRAKMRTALTVAALMVGVAMLLSIRAVTDAFRQDIQAWMDGYIGGDLYLYSSLPMRTDFGPRLEAVEGVAAVTPTRYLYVKRLKPDGGDESLAFMAVDPSSYRRVTSFIFAANQGDPDQLMDRLAAGDAVFISTVLSEMYGLEQGDTVRLETRRGQRDFEVAAVVVDFYDRGMVIEGSWRDLRRYFRLHDVSAFQLKIEPGHSLDQVEARIDRLYGTRRHLTIMSNEVLKAQALELTAQSFSLFDVLALIGVIVAALGVVNTLTMNVLERTQEIGMLRGVGMTRWQVSKMILAEAGMIGFIGGVFGVGFGLLLSRLFLTTANVTQGYALSYVLPTQGIVVGFFIALVVSQLAAIWPAQRAARINIIEAIQFE
ncbi:MAG: ABC transporter permease [Chloroflexi bacterium]|nr:ABC transporter permease [Chloroflexota bacterium]